MGAAVRIGRIGTWRGVAALALVATSVGAAVGVARYEGRRAEWARCGPGFVAAGARCMVPRAPAPCPSPLVAKAAGSARICDAPDERVLIPPTSFSLGPSDWEAEGRVTPRVVRTAAFRIDAFEATRGRFEGATDADAARAASGMTREEAARFCAQRGGRLPSEDEWMAAAASARSPARRYPWGDTGFVCRRAAWGLATGPCAFGAETGSGGPDTVGAHPDGDTPLRLHDVGGNVAEWVAPDPGDSPASTASPSPGASAQTQTQTQTQHGIAKGGSWQSALAADLRIWARLELDPAAHDPRVGVRCAYPAPYPE